MIIRTEIGSLAKIFGVIKSPIINHLSLVKYKNMKLKKELPLIAIVLLPFIYLAYIWNHLPERVPIHWNINGEIDRYGDKIELIIFPLFLPLLMYIMLLVIPKIDPKNKLNKMGNKFQNLKVIVIVFMSVLALFIIYIAKNQSLTNPNYIVLLIGVLYIILGNYFQTIRANYFIGIRTPWTLESENVWKSTHKLGGKLWFIGGIIVVISSLILNSQHNLILFLAITLIITVTPLVYSYLMFKKENETA